MTTEERAEQEAIAVGRRKIRRSQVTALIVGGLLLGSGLFGWGRWPLGFLIGLVYANGFEYLTHRFLLHRTAGYFYRAHQRHHESWRRWDEALYVRFGPPAAVVVLLLADSLPFALLDRFGTGIGAGALIAFVAYYMAYEEAHWRIHLGYLPARLQWMRRHHLAHHKGVPGRYGVLFPILDHLFAAGRTAPKTSGQL